MEKLKNIINAPLFQAGLAGGIGLLILMQGNVLYSGIAFGIGISKFFDAFK
ncbi:MAG: hypothetical protein GY760_13575 [Deltaproteobacteria bacterium]|nr:hypothetical protein [Deltaproteobacteria bacterium]